MSTARTFTAEFRSGLRATLTVSMTSVNCEWTPDIPLRVVKSTHKRMRMLEAYRTWRNDCLTEFARDHGLIVKTITVGGIDAIALCEPEGSA